MFCLHLLISSYVTFFKSVLSLVCNSNILCFTSLKLLGLLASENRIKEICLNDGNLNLIRMSDTRMR